MVEKEEKFDIIKNLRAYWRFAKPYWLYFIAVLFFVFLVSAASIGENYVLKVLLDSGADFSSKVITKDSFIEILFGLGAAFVVITLFKAIGNWYRNHFLNRAEGKMIYDLKKHFFNHIVSLSYKFHSTHKTGSLISRMTRGARAIEGISDFILFASAPLLIQLVVASVSIIYFDVSSVIVVIATIVFFVGFMLFLLKKQQDVRVAGNIAEDSEKGFMSDVFVNVETIKYYGKEKEVALKFGEFSQKTTDLFVANWDYERIVWAGQNIVVGVGTIMLIYFPLVSFIDGKISIGTLAFIYAVFLNLITPLYSFVWGLRRFYESLADFQSLVNYDEIERDVRDVSGARPIKILRGDIEFKNVSFTYNKKQVIKNFNLRVHPEEKVALVGYSGSGKTTLIRLLYRLYDLDEGEIRIDGKDISKIKQESLRSELSIVPQECILFNDTIYNNLIFANPKATKTDVANALKAAQLLDFVNSLPDKENTIVGERGIKLSGGERQRISIARAILANKKILVLDEATSSLDSKTEFEIKSALNKLMKKKTTIIIAHRLSTILESDRIVVLHKGEIVDVGTHDELIKKRGLYSKLWRLQKGGYISQ